MFQDVTLENELNRIVYEKVKREPYPAPIPYIDDDEVRKKISDLKAERIPRPDTKKEYFTLLDSLQSQIIDIRKCNEEIVAENSAAIKAVDDKFNSDIAAAKQDEVNIGEALSKCIDHELNQSLWYKAPDSKLSPAQETVASEWRDNMMNVTYTSTSISEALQKYNNLLSSKPDYNIKWSKK